MNLIPFARTISSTRRFTVITATCVATLAILHVDGVTTAGTLVVVPPSLEDVEGNDDFACTSLSSLSDSGRTQEVFPALEFSGVPEGYNVITSMRVRPDRIVKRDKVFTWDLYEVRLSTTNAAPGRELSSRFADNRGDDETVVYRGPVRWETDGAGPRAGPRAFDYVLQFTEPFKYDPREGKNLLLEETWLRSGGRGSICGDGQSSTTRVVLAMSDSAPTASLRLGLTTIRQFEFVPDFPLQAGDADQDLDFDQFDLVQVQQAAKYLTGEPATWGEGDWNGAPGGFPQIPPLGDGVFNQLDIVAAQQTAMYMSGAYGALQSTGPQAAQAPPEPTPQTHGTAALLIAESETGPDGGWTGPATLWLDGAEWAGNVTGVEHSDAVMDESSWHGRLLESYDFGELGTFALSLEGRTTFDVVEPEYRWHTYKAAGRLVEGTGAFAGAQGFFEVDGYTRWVADQESPKGMAWESAPGRIYSLIPEPSTVVLLLLGVLSTLSYNCRRRKTA